ncbi:fumarylacetoacetate hydrolase family protein [Pseudorhodoplanes sinuspersici]|uniref:fumarylacetoacetate hydrolase family protein n=1 Tax=Pseudorhodoplanes sinuspersici TaxID=1235591 RepID=UPI000FF0B5BC|nr:fumarylacetoacetate hydrolase family protein [Pseudorhodoplanes sinuspersici]RKE70588.1 2-keto-4-pentenoate hydratase/2-oxohepta-3-ene-1,7-dioic acid hydratase in catechol pathway [Pseudorhodoplanes sinuspersici]
MKYISFNVRGRSTFGLCVGKGIHDLGIRHSHLAPDLKAFLKLSSENKAPKLSAAPDQDYDEDEVRFEPAVPNPGKIICVGLNYHEHRKETGRADSQYPSIFTRFVDNLIAHEQPILCPAISTDLDYEGELAIVIGKSGYRIPKNLAIEHIGGYSCFNDATLRDWQRHTHQFTPGKNFPATAPLGPYLVTPDELDRFGDRHIETRLNGNLMQSAQLGDMIFTVEDVISYVSSFTPLTSGDVIAMGTPGGCGLQAYATLLHETW